MWDMGFNGQWPDGSVKMLYSSSILCSKKKSKKLRNITSFWAATRRLYNQHNFLVLQALLPGSRVPTVCQGLWCSGSDGRQHAAWGNSHFLCFWPLSFLSYRYCAHCIGLPALQESYAILESRVEDVELEVRGLSIYPALHRLLSQILPYFHKPLTLINTTSSMCLNHCIAYCRFLM